MVNEFIFLFHTAAVITFTFTALYLGLPALVALVCTHGILANLFVTKQIILFGFHVTASDVFAVGCIFTLNIIQEFFGYDTAKKIVPINFFITIFYLVMTQFHLHYLPSSLDTTHIHYLGILTHMPRIITASLVTFIIVQLCDTYIYRILKKGLHKTHLALRSFISLAISQALDTTLFSFLGLYGIVHNVWHIMLVSFIIKIVTVTCISAGLYLMKTTLKKHEL